MEKPSDLRDQQDLFGGGHSGASMGGVFGLQLKVLHTIFSQALL